MKDHFERAVTAAVLHRLSRPPALIQVITGPRQVGKTTAARAIADRWSGPVVFAAADELLPPDTAWIATQWDRARRAAGAGAALLILDEVQKVPGWSEAVKGQWDAGARDGRAVHVIVLGSSALLLSHGTTESLAGRFFLHRCGHWSWPEMRAAFGWDLDRWLYFGGYPGTAPLADEESAWRAYVRDALIEATLARDVLALQPVGKPALLRHLFALACTTPAQPVSYNKMLGQLQDAGNTATLAHYLQLLEQAFLVSGIEKWAGAAPRRRGTSPKLVPWNNALVSAIDGRSFEAARADRSWWGRLVENAVGAHLIGGLQGVGEVFWWRERDAEVDFVVRAGHRIWAVEVKSGRADRPAGLEGFLSRFPAAQPVIVGTGGVPLDEFFEQEAATFLGLARPGG